FMVHDVYIEFPDETSSVACRPGDQSACVWTGPLRGNDRFVAIACDNVLCSERSNTALLQITACSAGRVLCNGSCNECCTDADCRAPGLGQIGHCRDDSNCVYTNACGAAGQACCPDGTCIAPLACGLS